MEHPTTFNLNRALQNWRDELSQSPVFGGENMDELESHLRDSVALLQTTGLSAEEAFTIAVRRIGKEDSLENEYGKINAQAVWVDRLFWMLIGVQVWGLVSSLLRLLTSTAVLYYWSIASSAFQAGARTVPVAIFTLVQVGSLMGSFLLCWWLINRKGKNIAVRISPLLQRRATLVLTCIGLCALTCLPRLIGQGGALVFKSLKSTQAGTAVTSFAVADTICWLIQMIGMISVILVIASRRLRPSTSRNLIAD